MLPIDGARYLPTRVRRLSPAEIVRSARDVFASTRGTVEAARPALAIALAAFEVVPPFAAAGIEDEVFDTPPAVHAWLSALSGRISRAIADTAPRLHSESRIVGGFLDTYARRVIRQPLPGTDRDALLGLFEQTREHGSFTMGLATLVSQLFSDGRFATRTELGTQQVATRGTTTHTTLSHLELASALSYFIWGSAPSDQLLDAASLGILDDPRVLAGFTDVMLVDQRGQRITEVRDNVPETLLAMAFGAEGGAQIRLDENAVGIIAGNAHDPRAVTHAIVASPAFRVRSLV